MNQHHSRQQYVFNIVVTDWYPHTGYNKVQTPRLSRCEKVLRGEQPLDWVNHSTVFKLYRHECTSFGKVCIFKIFSKNLTAQGLHSHTGVFEEAEQVEEGAPYKYLKAENNERALWSWEEIKWVLSRETLRLKKNRSLLSLWVCDWSHWGNSIKLWLQMDRGVTPNRSRTIRSLTLT